MSRRNEQIDTGDGAMPVTVLGELAANRPAAIVIPSIFGPADDLLTRLESIATEAAIVVTDPFWRVGAGPVPYDDITAAFAKVTALDRPRCFEDINRVVAWTRGRAAKIAGLGICFGGPFCLLGAADGWFDGIVTWHGSRMENYLERAQEMQVPMKLHFGGADQFVSSDVVDKVRTAFTGRDDIDIVVHPDCDHGYSHAGAAWNASAADASLDALRSMLVHLAG